MFLTLLSILFVGLKLTGVIDWNWILVLSPLLVNFARLVFKEMLKSAYRKGEPWAVKFVRYMYD